MQNVNVLFIHSINTNNMQTLKTQVKIIEI